jgi:hypothetical protein
LRAASAKRVKLGKKPIHGPARCLPPAPMTAIATISPASARHSTLWKHLNRYPFSSVKHLRSCPKPKVLLVYLFGRRSLLGFKLSIRPGMKISSPSTLTTRERRNGKPLSGFSRLIESDFCRRFRSHDNKPIARPRKRQNNPVTRSEGLMRQIDLFNAASVAILCPGCGHSMKRKITRLQKQPDVACSRCRASVRVDINADEFRRAIRSSARKKTDARSERPLTPTG